MESVSEKKYDFIGCVCLRVRIFQIDKLYLKGKVQGAFFPHFREDKAITKFKDYLKSLDKQPKVKEYDALLAPVDDKHLTGLTSLSVNFTTSRRIRLPCGGEKMNAVFQLVKNQLGKVSSAFVIIRKANRVLKCRTF